ncbi:AmmeMemoRadiSam system protein B [candidate division WOR-3 bacterium]|nr:AmmeMemoRadiSam system protein B [candidate division WOR-3 bacterium]
MPDKAREPVFSGQFYPGDRHSLEKELSFLLPDASSLSFRGKVSGLVLPHAGYAFSGETTGKAVASVDPEKYEKTTVILLAPCHRYPSKGASVYKSGAWKTPLGNVPVDEELTELLLRESALFDDSEMPHLSEHSIEVQLPFFQYVFKSRPLRIVPIAVGNQSSEFCLSLGESLKPLAGNDRIFVASSDLYHGYSLSECEINDEEVVGSVQSYDLKKLCDIADRGTKVSDQAGCGIGPIIALLTALKDIKKDIFLSKKANSSESPYSDGGYVVGYASFVIL